MTVPDTDRHAFSRYSSNDGVILLELHFASCKNALHKSAHCNKIYTIKTTVDKVWIPLYIKTETIKLDEHTAFVRQGMTSSPCSLRWSYAISLTELKRAKKHNFI